MKLDKAYTHCPRCGHELKQEEKFLLVCTHCHYKLYLSPFPCNAAIIENDQGEILLVKRAFDPQKGFYDLPGGFIEPGEDLATSVKRELTEELGCTIEVTKVLGGYTDEYLYQDVLLPTLGIVVVGRLTSSNLSPADDINGYDFFAKDDVLQQKIAFPSVRQALKDYLG